MNVKAKNASELFCSGLYCSQAVLMTFCEDYGMDKETSLRISCGLNSGARCSDICGAASGAILVIGLKHGDSNELCNKETEEFLKRFKEKCGGIACRDILGCDISTPEGKAKATEENLFGTVCRDAVADTAQILCDMGY
jgi:C_GCAxxG_C_C family probable redox protein